MVPYATQCQAFPSHAIATRQQSRARGYLNSPTPGASYSEKPIKLLRDLYADQAVITIENVRPFKGIWSNQLREVRLTSGNG